MRISIPSILTIVLAVATLALGNITHAAGPELKTDENKTLYSIGVLLSQNAQGFNLSADEVEFVVSGFRDGITLSDPKVEAREFLPKIQALQAERATKAAEVQKGAAKDFLAKAEKEAGAVKTDSGMIYQESKAGEGDFPAATDTVKVHYHGTLIDGTVFDSSVNRGEPFVTRLDGVIKCWTEGVQKMKPGGKAKLICPSEIAYGDRGAGPLIKPGATLIFDVELLEVVK